ncbi:hypothetical protein [Chitinophaga rupis]|uniref:hypothetical protein n=1 Tax=Chitinophaga rupis TaxID=573321 RepID=UPI0011602A1B|nr:hypothetical protein [Chitinophaga rupis]
MRAFCGDLDESKSCLSIIQRYDTDKFKPLVNYLNGKSKKTDPKNIELLAWLIDLPGRPWEMGKSYSGEPNADPPLSDTNPEAGELGTIEYPTGNPPANERNTPAGIIGFTGIPIGLQRENEKESVETKTEEAGKQVKKGRSTKRLAATVVLSLVLATGGAWLWKSIYTGPDYSGGCMYWSEDHYKPIACDQKIPNVMIIALDTVKVKNFRKITTPDTITYLAIGKVWYSKIDNKFEFYTSGGEHPIVYGRRLKPITKYIIDLYIHPGTITNSN